MSGFVSRFFNPSWMLWLASPFIFGSLLQSARVQTHQSRYDVLLIVLLSLIVGLISFFRLGSVFQEFTGPVSILCMLVTASILLLINHERREKIDSYRA